MINAVHSKATVNTKWRGDKIKTYLHTYNFVITLKCSMIICWRKWLCGHNNFIVLAANSKTKSIANVCLYRSTNAGIM